MQNNMNGKFGGGKFATITPLLEWSCVVVVCSLLGGASIVHNIYKPNLVSFLSFLLLQFEIRRVLLVLSPSYFGLLWILFNPIHI